MINLISQLSLGVRGEPWATSMLSCLQKASIFLFINSLLLRNNILGKSVREAVGGYNYGGIDKNIERVQR